MCRVGSNQENTSMAMNKVADCHSRKWLDLRVYLDFSSIRNVHNLWQPIVLLRACDYFPITLRYK